LSSIKQTKFHIHKDLFWTFDHNCRVFAVLAL
jgi:hypothetical protein